MLSGSPWCKLQRRLLALLFIMQYHCRMSFLNLRYKARNISRADIDLQARDSWNKLCQALAAHRLLQEALRTTRKRLEQEQFTAVLQTVKKRLANEHLHTTLQKAKNRLEQVILTEEAPTQLLDAASLEKLKATWHALETSKIPRITPETIKAARHPLKTLQTVQQRRVMLIGMGFAALLLITLFAESGLANRALHTFKTLSFSTTPQLVFSELSTFAHQTSSIEASKALVRISQLDQSEYASQDEYNTWAYSACSAASMTEVFNAYGRHYRITDVLKVESSVGAITPELGLLNGTGVAETAAKFGFQTTWGDNWTLDQVLENANAGRPVIVGWPPDLYEDGHIVVVTGGDATHVYLADSSLWNRKMISVAQFMQWWAGFAAVVTPA